MKLNQLYSFISSHPRFANSNSVRRTFNLLSKNLGKTPSASVTRHAASLVLLAAGEKKIVVRGMYVRARQKISKPAKKGWLGQIAATYRSHHPKKIQHKVVVRWKKRLQSTHTVNIEDLQPVVYLRDGFAAAVGDTVEAVRNGSSYKRGQLGRVVEIDTVTPPNNTDKYQFIPVVRWENDQFNGDLSVKRVSSLNLCQPHKIHQLLNKNKQKKNTRSIINKKKIPGIHSLNQMLRHRHMVDSKINIQSNVLSAAPPTLKYPGIPKNRLSPNTHMWVCHGILNLTTGKGVSLRLINIDGLRINANICARLVQIGTQLLLRHNNNNNINATKQNCRSPVSWLKLGPHIPLRGMGDARLIADFQKVFVFPSKYKIIHTKSGSTLVTLRAWLPQTTGCPKGGCYLPIAEI